MDNNHLENVDKVTQRIREVRRIADDSMTQLDNHETQIALRNYHDLRREFNQEAVTYNTIAKDDLPELAINYMTEVQAISLNLPEKVENGTLYNLFHSIFKSFHSLL